MYTQRTILKTGLLLMTLLWLSPASGQSQAQLLQEADQFFREGKTEEARERYEVLVARDSSSFEALAWLGNYYYLKGKDEWTSLERAYKEVREPTRMQAARHQEALKGVYASWYGKAEACLLKALDVRKNEHLQALLDEVVRIKTRLGISKPVEPGRRRKKD